MLAGSWLHLLDIMPAANRCWSIQQVSVNIGITLSLAKTPMYRITVIVLLATLLSTSAGCVQIGGFFDKIHYPFSCPRCPYYDYENGQWREFMFDIIPIVDTSRVGTPPANAPEALPVPGQEMVIPGPASD